MQLGAVKCKLAHFGASWCQLVQFDVLLVQVGAVWCSFVDVGSFWFKLVQFGAS